MAARLFPLWWPMPGEWIDRGSSGTAVRAQVNDLGPDCGAEAPSARTPGFTTVPTKSPIAPSVAPNCSICGKWAASGIGAKWPLGKASA